MWRARFETTRDDLVLEVLPDDAAEDRNVHRLFLTPGKLPCPPAGHLGRQLERDAQPAFFQPPGCAGQVTGRIRFPWKMSMGM